MPEYNTREIRAAARKLDNIADKLQRVKTSEITRISSNAKPLRGDAANALQDQLESLSSEVMALKKSLDACAIDLYNFARRLDIADAKAKESINSN